MSSQRQAVSKPTVPLRERIDAWWVRAREFGSEHYGVDTRALGLFRIGLGLMLLYDLYSRSLDMTAHYTDEGLMPRQRLVGGWVGPLFYSFHNWGGNVASQAILFAVAAVFAAMLLVGYRTRLASVLSFVLLTSLQGRNYLILQGGDDILRVMTFWALFTPLAGRYSVDAVLAAHSGTKAPAPARVFTIGSLALVCQLFAMYVVSAILKAGPAWHQNGNAIYLAIHHHAFATNFGIWLREVPEPVLRSATHAVWWLEMVGPFLFFVPFRTHLSRTLLALSYIAFHFGLFLSMNLGHFPWICMLCWLLVLPTWFWDKPFARLLASLSLKPVLEAAALRAAVLVQGFAPRLKAPRGLIFAAPQRWTTAFAALMVAYVAHGTAYAAEHHGNVDGAAYEPLMMIRMNANWGMFAPNPPSESGWFVFVGKQKNGREVDPWRDGAPVSWEQPPLPSTTYKVERWRKFLDNIINPRHAVVRPYFLRWMCNDWNQRHSADEQLKSLEFFHMVQNVSWPEKGYQPLRKNALGKQTCPALPRTP